MRCPGVSVLCLSPPLVALLLTRLAIRFEVVDVLDIAQCLRFTIYRRIIRARRPNEALRSRDTRSYCYLFMVSVRGFTPSSPI